MKSTGTIEGGDGLWYSPNTDATNESGFTAIPGGEKNYFGGYDHIGLSAHFWLSGETAVVLGDLHAYRFGLRFDSSFASHGSGYFSFGSSVRCIKD